MSLEKYTELEIAELESRITKLDSFRRGDYFIGKIWNGFEIFVMIVLLPLWIIPFILGWNGFEILVTIVLLPLWIIPFILGVIRERFF